MSTDMNEEKYENPAEGTVSEPTERAMRNASVRTSGSGAESPARKAYTRLSANVRAYRKFVHHMDLESDNNRKRGTPLGDLAPPSFEQWNESSPKISAEDKAKLERDILDDPEGAEVAAFYLGKVLNGDEFHTKRFGTQSSGPEESECNTAEFEEKAAETGQSALFVAMYRKSRFPLGESSIKRDGLWDKYLATMRTYGVSIPVRQEHEASSRAKVTA